MARSSPGNRAAHAHRDCTPPPAPPARADARIDRTPLWLTPDACRLPPPLS
jgi:hypothetical protein